MNQTRRPALAVVALALAACGGSQTEPTGPEPAAAKPAPAAQPTADEILARYIEVTGGEDRYRSIESLTASGALEMKGAGMKGTLKTSIAGGKALTVVELGGVGTIRQGSDGETVWSIDPMTGARIIEGVERNQIVRSLDLLAMFNRDKYYKSVTFEGKTEVDGKPVYAVKMVDNDDLPETSYFDVESGLLLKTEGVTRSQMGEMKTVNTVERYGEFDGLKLPIQTSTKIGPVTQVVLLEKVEINPKIDPATFALPPEIKKLKKK